MANVLPKLPHIYKNMSASSHMTLVLYWTAKGHCWSKI